MSHLVIVLGASGSGKSTSIKTLKPEDTVVINVLGKDLPFKGSRTNYSKEKKNLVASSSWNSIFSMLNSISTKCPNIHNIVIDDATYIMRTEYFDRSKEKGYDKYSELADHFRKIISLGNSLRNDITVFLMLHSEVVESDGSIIGYKAATIGKLLDKQYNPLESVSITLYAAPKYADNGKPEFGFWTHPMKVNGIEIPAKSPDEMFEEDFIPNSLQLVLDKMNEYYNA